MPIRRGRGRAEHAARPARARSCYAELLYREREACTTNEGRLHGYIVDNAAERETEQRSGGLGPLFGPRTIRFLAATWVGPG